MIKSSVIHLSNKFKSIYVPEVVKRRELCLSGGNQERSNRKKESIGVRVVEPNWNVRRNKTKTIRTICMIP